MQSIHDVEVGSFRFQNKFFLFDGETRGGRPWGPGTLTLGDGTVLTGFFEKGDLQGDGVKRWADGSVYTGQFVRGEPHGKGRLLDIASGSDYNGDFNFGSRHGRGRLASFKLREIYEGDFRLDKCEGNGVLLRYPTGAFMNMEASPSDALDAMMKTLEDVDAPQTSDPNATRASAQVAAAVLRSRISSVAIQEGQLERSPHLQGEKASTEGLASRSTRAHHSSDRTIIYGTFHRGLMEGPRMSAVFANGDLYEGPAVAGEWCGDSCDFFAAGGSIRYNGPMRHSQRAEIPNAIVISEVFHESQGSMVGQLSGGDGYLRVTTSVLITLQQVVRSVQLVEVCEPTSSVKGKPSSRPPASAKAAAATASAVTAQLVEREVLEPCTHESGRPVRATIYRLETPMTESQKQLKRIPRDATRALFATEPLTPRLDAAGNSERGGGSVTRTPSARTPGQFLEAQEGGDSALSPSATETRSAEGSPTPAGGSSTRLGRQGSKARNSSKGGITSVMSLDQGRSLLTFTMEDGAVTLKIAPLTRESGDFLVKIEVYVAGGIQRTPGDASDAAMLPPQVFMVPMHVAR